MTGRSICAIPCDGITEMCEDDIDEQCEGPGLVLVMVFTFISSVLFLAVASTFDSIARAKIVPPDSFEMEEYHNLHEWFISNIWIDLSVHQHTSDYVKAKTIAAKYYEYAASINKMACPNDEYFMRYIGTNKISVFFYDCVNRSVSVKVISFFNNHMPKIFHLWNNHHVSMMRITFKCIITLTLRYSDLPKDLLLLYIIWIQLLATDSGMFSVSIFWTLVFSIVTSEIMHVFTIMMNNKNSKTKSVIKMLHDTLATPIMPAIYQFRHLKLKIVTKRLLDKVSKKCNKNIKQAQQELQELDCKMHRLDVISAKLHCNENVLENLFQVTILVIFVLLSYTNSKTVESIDYLFLKKDNAITYILTLMSLISMIRGQINFLKANKNGCLGLVGTVITIPYFLIGIASRFVT